MATKSTTINTLPSAGDGTTETMENSKVETQEPTTLLVTEPGVGTGTEPIETAGGIAMVALHSHNYLSSPGGHPTALRKGVVFAVYDADLAKEYEDSGEAVRAAVWAEKVESQG